MSALSVSQFWSSWNSLIEPASGLWDSAASSEGGQGALSAPPVQRGVSHDGFDNPAVVDDPFCPLLLVNDEEGETLTVGGLICSKKQQEIFEVRRELKSGGSHDVILRAYVAEGGDRDGILLESALGFQLAFLDTSTAFHATSPYINIIRPNEASHGTLVPSEALSGSASALESSWAVVKRSEKSGDKMVSSSLVNVYRVQNGRQGDLIMTVRTNPSADTANIADPRGRLLASMVTRRNDAGNEIMVVQVGGGDAGLYLCSLMAALKLS